MAMSDKDPKTPVGNELSGAEHYPYKLGLYHNDELAPDYVKTHR